ncbi:MAG: hypothetical protein KGZ75_12495 [Syntrophomonadaceae bacterium]|nr:hypothetical protein [Syntrophomonadaceae bacterium]
MIRERQDHVLLFYCLTIFLAVLLKFFGAEEVFCPACSPLREQYTVVHQITEIRLEQIIANKA